MSANVPDAGLPLYDNEKLRAWRRAAGLSREQVWAEVGCSVAWLQELEQGTSGRSPSLDLLTRLAKFYGHEPAELLTTSAA